MTNTNAVSITEILSRWKKQAEELRVEVEESATPSALYLFMSCLSRERRLIAALETAVIFLEIKCQCGNGKILVCDCCCRRQDIAKILEGKAE